MRKLILASCCVALLAVAGVWPAQAQGQGARGGPDPNAVRDAEIEQDALHNLDVARFSFRRRAYRASLARLEEVVVGYPNFSRMDEALYLAGMSSLYLSKREGRQQPTLTPEQHREDARNYLSRVVNDFPDSAFRARAETELRALGGVRPRESAPQAESGRP